MTGLASVPKEKRVRMDKPYKATDMSPYELRAWEQSLKRLHEPPGKKVIPQRVRDVAGKSAQKVGDFADEHLPAQQAKEILDKAMNGAFGLTFVPSLRSASVEGAVAAYRKKHAVVESVDDLKKLDVREIDKFRRNKILYATGAGLQGTATSLVITGSTVSTTVSGGATAGVVLGALAGDAIATLALMGRTVGSVAVRYGYDIREPEEELFAMGVISLGTATNAHARYAALASLSKLSQQMMRQATWEQLNSYVLVKVLQRVFKALGLRLVHRKLAQIVPIAGVAINGALSAHLTQHLYQRADDVYRVRFLSEKYGLDAEEWLVGYSVEDETEEGAVAETDILEILEEELRIDREGPEAA